MKAKNNIPMLILSLALPLALGSLAAYLARDGIRMYALLPKPPLSPPSWIFPVVWTVLYILMGTASYLVWRSDAAKKRKGRALWLYAAQLAVNFLWPLLFFGAELYLAALLCLLLLILLVLLCTLLFYHIDTLAGWLLLPYNIWCAFALYLNFSVFLLMK